MVTKDKVFFMLLENFIHECPESIADAKLSCSQNKGSNHLCAHQVVKSFDITT